MTPKQSLLIFASRHNLTVTALLNLLQEYGRISDLCVTFADVAECDAETALEWLKEFVK